MNPGAKVGGFLVGLVVVGAVGAGVGSLAGPIDTGSDEASHGAEHQAEVETEIETTTTDAPGSTGHGGHGAEADEAPDGSPAETSAAPGTSSTQDGYRLVVVPADEDEIRFEVLDPDGAPVVDTEKPLHLVLVGVSSADYAHVHPVVDADGTWSVARPDLTPDGYRMVADLTPVDGPELVLATDIGVPGERPTRGGVPVAGNPTTVDGITVTFEGTPTVGDTELAFSAVQVTPDEPVPVPVEPEPHLGARGHLVAFRAGDLAYVPVDPHDDAEGPVTFTVGFPTADRYALYLDLEVDGVVRTFPFTVEVHGHG